MKIAELKVNDNCDITLVVTAAIARETKAKKPYLSLDFTDGTDKISGNYWDWTSGNIPEINSIVDVTCQVTEWQGTKQLNIRGMRINHERHLADFAPASNVNLSQVYNDAYALAGSIQDDFLRNLTMSIFEQLLSQWLTVPGARSIHHAYIGGTLVHSYGVARIANSIASSMPNVNRDLCIAGALLHDLGKLFTYRIDGLAINLTDDGKLFDHIFMGAEFVGNFAENMPGYEEYENIHKIRLLRHIILSHHGSLDCGSPVTPMCIEAYIVNRADGLDALAEQINSAARKVPEDIKWTDRIYTLANRPHLTPAYIEKIMSYEEESLEEKISE